MKIPIDQLIYSDTLPPEKSLVESIEKFDKILPIVVTPEGDKFRVHIGNRSVAALKELGRAEVEATVSELDGTVLTIIGNLHRNPNPIAEGEAIQSLLGRGWTKERIAEELGVPLHKQYSLLRLVCNLTPELKQKIADGNMSCEAGRIACNLSQAEQKNLAENEKVSIAKAKSARRAEQLTLLDLESVEIPKVSEIDQLMDGLARLCTKLRPTDKRRGVLETAIEALESLREKENKNE